MPACQNRWLSLVVGILMIILGIWMFFTPAAAIITVTMFLSLGMLIFGITEIYMFRSKHYGDHSGWVLAGGIISTLLGIWMLLFPSGQAGMLVVLPFLFAFWVMSAGVARVSGAFSLKQLGSASWGWVAGPGSHRRALGLRLDVQPDHLHPDHRGADRLRLHLERHRDHSHVRLYEAAAVKHLRKTSPSCARGLLFAV